MVYDAALVATSVAFGVGACTRRHPAWPILAYAAGASVLFRVHRCTHDGRGMPALWAHDLAAALAAIAVTLHLHPSRTVRERVAIGTTLMALAHCTRDTRTFRVLHTAGHVTMVAAAWTGIDV